MRKISTHDSRVWGLANKYLVHSPDWPREQESENRQTKKEARFYWNPLDFVGLLFIPMYSIVLHFFPGFCWIPFNASDQWNPQYWIGLSLKEGKARENKVRKKKKEWRLIITRHKLYNEDERLK